jgi:hypothetical protein
MLDELCFEVTFALNNQRMNKNTPLIVDLDHTLIDTDLLVESSIATLKKSPWLVALYPFWLLQGKGYLKAQLKSRIWSPI